MIHSAPRPGRSSPVSCPLGPGCVLTGRPEGTLHPHERLLGHPSPPITSESESGRFGFARREFNLGWPCASKPCTSGSKEQEHAQREGSSEVNQDEHKNEPPPKEDQREGEAHHSDVPTLGGFPKSAGERFSRGEVPRGSCEPSAQRSTDACN